MVRQIIFIAVTFLLAGCGTPAVFEIEERNPWDDWTGEGVLRVTRFEYQADSGRVRIEWEENWNLVPDGVIPPNVNLWKNNSPAYSIPVHRAYINDYFVYAGRTYSYELLFNVPDRGFSPGIPLTVTIPQ